MRPGTPPYPPIGDYALIGDTRTAALVGRDGSIDWCCWPRFDGPAAFCRLLDAEKGGWFRVGPAGAAAATRSYVGPTNVLATTFEAAGGRVRVTDLMPAPGRPTGQILRLVEGLSGVVDVAVEFRPTFGYARAETDLSPCPWGATARAGTETLRLACSVGLRAGPNGSLTGTAAVSAGDQLWVTLSYRDGDGPADPVSAVAAKAELGRALSYWEDWAGRCTYRGPYRDLVLRSALALKLLTYGPTGAVVAAPTTSLPEEVGGVRNWDYRYTWLRDSALILHALMDLGYHDEAVAFFGWLESLCLECRGDPQIMYTVSGGADLPEDTLDHLDGYRGSRPVRVGNGAAGQTQLDVYGEVLDATFVCFERMPRPVRPELWAVLSRFADRAAARWREPDRGIWEVRGGPRHFLHSKLLCWVALDRALRLADRAGLSGDVARWERERAAVREAILADGYDRGVGAFTQSFGSADLDASALTVPLVGFLPATDPRVRSTVDRVRERLTSRGLVYRYRGDDGLPGGEATFALCSFWLVNNLALGGRVGEARELFERVAGYANDVGLLAEQIDPSTGDLLGNFPQGFTHLALVRSALTLAAADGTETQGDR